MNKKVEYLFKEELKFDINSCKGNTCNWMNNNING